jgi:hypothetical protein
VFVVFASLFEVPPSIFSLPSLEVPSSTLSLSLSGVNFLFKKVIHCALIAYKIIHSIKLNSKQILNLQLATLVL